MNPLEVHTLISQGLQTFGSFILEDWKPEEIDIQYNARKLDFIDDILIRAKGAGYQDSQRLLDNIRQLQVKNHELTPLPFATIDNVYEVTFPNNPKYLHLIKSRSKVKYKCVENGKEITKKEVVTNRLVDDDQLDLILQDSFAKTSKQNPVTVISGNKLYIYTDGTFELDNVYIDYLKEPNKMVLALDNNGDYDSGNSVSCEFNSSTQLIIANKVVSYLSSITPRDGNKFQNLVQTTKTN